MAENSIVRILVLDDEEDVRDMYIDILTTEIPNCEVTPISNSAQIIDAIEAMRINDCHYDVVLTDYSVLREITDNLSLEAAVIGLIKSSQ